MIRLVRRKLSFLSHYAALEHGSSSEGFFFSKLSICWFFAKLLEGTFDLDSQLDQGRRFVLCLPRLNVDVVVSAADDNFFLFNEMDVELENF
jgi:hypothetical protein